MSKNTLEIDSIEELDGIVEALAEAREQMVEEQLAAEQAEFEFNAISDMEQAEQEASEQVEPEQFSISDQNMAIARICGEVIINTLSHPVKLTSETTLNLERLSQIRLQTLHVENQA